MDFNRIDDSSIIGIEGSTENDFSKSEEEDPYRPSTSLNFPNCKRFGNHHMKALENAIIWKSQLAKVDVLNEQSRRAKSIFEMTTENENTLIGPPSVPLLRKIMENEECTRF